MSTTRRLLLFLGVPVLVGGVAAGVALGTRSATHSGATTDASNAVVDRAALQRSLGQSEAVLRVRVASVGPAQWTTADGTAPSLQTLRTSHYQILPVSPVTFDVEHVYRGTVSGGQLTLWVPGGEPPAAGTLRSSVENHPLPAVGSEAILFLGASTDWRHGTGSPLPGRLILQDCVLTSSTAASCSGSTVLMTDLMAVVG